MGTGPSGLPRVPAPPWPNPKINIVLLLCRASRQGSPYPEEVEWELMGGGCVGALATPRGPGAGACLELLLQGEGQ